MTMAITIVIGLLRLGVSKSDPSAGGFTRGSVVASPHRKQISALSAISVPQLVQIIVHASWFYLLGSCSGSVCCSRCEFWDRRSAVRRFVRRVSRAR